MGRALNVKAGDDGFELWANHLCGKNAELCISKGDAASLCLRMGKYSGNRRMKSNTSYKTVTTCLKAFYSPVNINFIRFYITFVMTFKFPELVALRGRKNFNNAILAQFVSS